ncbi:peptidylprolyl isomerase [Lysobacter silvisoli]|uniref:peptidylprolyl isomerase n=1 Tax=Lysobacter silvisoli TaxID=2293254 RepID=A0A371K1H3_9GAMM|nr:peptidylprolyl isomerase [Lysobacter silvisoli]
MKLHARSRTARPSNTRLSPLLAAALAVGLALPLSAGAADSAKPRSMQEILDATKPGDWRALDPRDTLYLDLPRGRVVIELAPEFAPQHATNIRALARNGYWNKLSINRSQDNFVVQWGDPAEDDKSRKPLGKGTKAKLPAEFERSSDKLPFHVLPDPDGWAPQVGFADGFPAARDTGAKRAWLAHCYGMVGAGRDVAADSSNGTELYVVIGQSPRQLDRNITVVGRVVQGMELLSVLPRGTGPLGFYENPAQRVPITSIRLAADVAKKDRVAIEVLRTDSAAFDEIIESRRNRRDEWYKHPAGHIDLCNVPLPTRETPAAAPAPAKGKSKSK